MHTSEPVGFACGLNYYSLICAGVNIVVGPLKPLVGFIRKRNALMLGSYFCPKLDALRDISAREITQKPMQKFGWQLQRAQSLTTSCGQKDHEAPVSTDKLLPRVFPHQPVM